MEIGGLGGVDDEQGARQGGDGHGPHVDPVGRHQILSRKTEEHVTIKDEHHDPDVEYAAPEPKGEGNEVEF